MQTSEFEVRPGTVGVRLVRLLTVELRGESYLKELIFFLWSLDRRPLELILSGHAC